MRMIDKHRICNARGVHCVATRECIFAVNCLLMDEHLKTCPSTSCHMKTVERVTPNKIKCWSGGGLDALVQAVQKVSQEECVCK